MKYFLAVICCLLAGPLFISSASAKCGSNCRAKCDATWYSGGHKSAQACYTLWSAINAKCGGKRAVQFQGRIKRDSNGIWIIPC